MNIEMTIMTKIDMPNIRIEVRDENFLFVADTKLERKPMRFDIVGGISNMPSLIGFKIIPILSEPEKNVKKG